VKLICKQEDLARGLSVVSRAVSSKSTLPILGNVLLTAGYYHHQPITSDAESVEPGLEGGLKLTATNLEIGISMWIPAEVAEEGLTTAYLQI
jgi:DNA polymerase-3 subunit beta